MKKRATPAPSDLELQVLSVLWERGPLTVRQVLEAMPDGKQRAYTTILSVMQVMEKKGLLAHRAAGVRHVYRPKVKQRQVLRPLLRGLVQNVFGGSASAAVRQLVDATEDGADELVEVRRALAASDSNDGPHTGDEKRPGDENRRQIVGELLERAFDGSALELVAALIDNRMVSDSEIDRVKQLIRKHEQEADK